MNDSFGSKTRGAKYTEDVGYYPASSLVRVRGSRAKPLQAPLITGGMLLDPLSGRLATAECRKACKP